MKKTRIYTVQSYLLACVFVITSCRSQSSLELKEEDKQYIRDITNNVQESWNQGHLEPYVNRFSADAVFMAANMEAVVGKDAIRSFANSFPTIKIGYSIAEIVGSGEFAYVRGAYSITNRGDTLLDKGKYISIWKKFPDNKWLLTHDIFNSDLPVPIAK